MSSPWLLVRFKLVESMEPIPSPGVPGDELVTLIDEIEAEIEASGVDVASYIAAGTEHTILGRPEFYGLTVAGERFVDWATLLVVGEVPADVRCRRCT